MQKVIKNIQNNLFKYLGLCALLFFIVLGYVFYEIFVPVNNLPVEQTFTIKKDENGEQVFMSLKENGYIKSIFWAKVVFKGFEHLGRGKFFRGDYTFQSSDSLYNIIYDITKRPVSLAVLIPEGFTKVQIADRLAKYISHFDRSDFLKKAKEGYLFPETYYFYAFSTNDEILDEFNDKFNKNVFLKFGRYPTEEEVIIASMVEREAKKPEDMKIISGIIRNRLKEKMPLQIDATVLYGKGAWKNRVLYSDLKHQSDYNTYINTGLPIAPISNPGINALDAAVNPRKTDYFFYITGRDGNMYYAQTGLEHLKNIAKYLR